MNESCPAPAAVAIPFATSTLQFVVVCETCEMKIRFNAEDSAKERALEHNETGL